MGTGVKIAIVAAIVAVFGIVMVGVYGVSVSNKEVRVRNQGKMQQKNLEVVYDETWKVISQIAQVADKYADDFKDIYSNIMSERYSKGDGSLMKWVHERNPDFDPSLYNKLANAIEGKRAKFAAEQKKMLEIKRVHDDIRLTFPSSLICGGRPEIEVQLVTSAKTQKAFETGEENDVNVFGGQE
jgi:hypothetical protein